MPATNRNRTQHRRKTLWGASMWSAAATRWRRRGLWHLGVVVLGKVGSEQRGVEAAAHHLLHHPPGPRAHGEPHVARHLHALGLFELELDEPIRGLAVGNPGAVCGSVQDLVCGLLLRLRFDALDLDVQLDGVAGGDRKGANRDGAERDGRRGAAEREGDPARLRVHELLVVVHEAHLRRHRDALLGG
eukprot:18929-Rhodomonas_salina.4